MFKLNQKFSIDIIEVMLAISLAAIFYTNLRPYFLWDVNAEHYKVMVLSFVLLSLIYFRNNALRINTKILISFVLYCLFIVFCLISNSGFSPLNIFTIIAFSVCLFLPYKALNRSYIFCYNFYCYSLLLSLATYLLVVVGFGLDWSHLPSLNSIKPFDYRNYIFLVVYQGGIVPFGSGEVFRFSGLFDEPGVIGTLSALFLAFNGLNLKCWKAKVVLIAGLCSMSLAFYILLTIIFLLKFNIRNFSILFVLSILFLVIYPKGENVIFDRYIYDRVENVFRDVDSVNNRTGDKFEQDYISMYESLDFLVGNGRGASQSKYPEGFSYKYFIYDYGVLSFIFINLMYVILIFGDGVNRSRAIFFVVLSLSLLQRPYYDHMFVLLLVMCFSSVSNKSDLPKILINKYAK